MADLDAVGLPFDEAVDYFRQKVDLPTARWNDLKHGAHVRAWSVAGAIQADLLADLRKAIDRAIAEGTTKAEFGRAFDEAVGRYGWAHTGSRDFRVRVIYETNLAVAHQAGRYKQMTDPDVLRYQPFWIYRHGGSETPRPLHLAWSGTVLPADDPWFNTHFPRNGWGCNCWVEPLTRRELTAMGKDGPDQAPDNGTYRHTDRQTGETWDVPRGIDPGWDYNPGKDWLHGSVPRELQAPLKGSGIRPPNLPDLPNPVAVPASRILPAGLTDQDYVERFLAEFGATIDQPALFRDASGTRIVISADLFRQADGVLKIGKRDRRAYALLLADTIKDPHEIWVDWMTMTSGDVVLRRRYLRSADSPGAKGLFTTFEWGRPGWRGVTAFNASASYVDRARTGALIYRKSDG